MNQPDPSKLEPAWSAETRSWVSLLLFVHLFALFVAVTTYTRPSNMQLQMHRLFGTYLRPLHLTPFPYSYPFARYYLTLNMPSDVDFQCIVEYEPENGEPGTYTIPEPGLLLPIRVRRYQALANAAGTLAADEESDDLSSDLPKAIGGAILRRHGASQGVVRLRAHDIPEMEQMGLVDSGNRGPLESFRDIYEAQVFLSGDTVELLKKSTTLETAPVEGPKRTQP